MRSAIFAEVILRSDKNEVTGVKKVKMAALIENKRVFLPIIFELSEQEQN